MARRHLVMVPCLVALVGLLAGPVGLALGEDCIAVEDFAKAPLGQFPPDWKVRKEAGKQVYTVQAEAGRTFLHAVARDLGIQAAKPFSWNPTTHPVLAWSWRPRQFPTGADERSGKNDSALAVYVVFPHSRISVKSVKYIWSEKVPVDTHLTSSHGMTQVRVLRSGREGLDEWADARANVLEDYRRHFGEADVPKPEGIAVLTDSDDTESVAIGDYANLRVCRE
jgi:Protein of unknown function (DUF3047)